MSNLNFEEFQWFKPQPKEQYAITISNLDCLRLNPKLVAELSSSIGIGISEDGQKICIREDVDDGYRVPKSGTITDRLLIQALISTGIRLPVRYTVRRVDGCWLATMDASPLKQVIEGKRPRKPKSSDIKILTEELESL